MIAIKRQVVNVDDEVTFVAKNKKEIESVCLHNHMLSWLEEHAEPFVESWMNQRLFILKSVKYQNHSWLWQKVRCVTRLLKKYV